MLLFCLAMMTLIFGGMTIGGWLRRQEEKRAHLWVASFHGERLPPAETLRDKGHSATFLLTLMPYYMEQQRRDEAALKAKSPLPPPFPQTKWSKEMLEKVTPIDPDTEPDCPECANGVSHDTCRDGWKAQLRENVREYAIAKFGSMPAWKPPCDTCGSNCGQCASSHCGICGVKPRDGKCDLVQHEAFKLARPDEWNRMVRDRELRESHERRALATARIEKVAHSYGVAAPPPPGCEFCRSGEFSYGLRLASCPKCNRRLN